MGLAARGSRNLYETEERIEDAAELAQVERQARRVNQKTLLAALIATLLVMALSAW